MTDLYEKLVEVVNALKASGFMVMLEPTRHDVNFRLVRHKHAMVASVPVRHVNRMSAAEVEAWLAEHFETDESAARLGPGT